MPTPRPYERYPAEYTRLFRRALHESVTVMLESHAIALRLRNHLYGFRESIRDSTERDKVPDDLMMIAPLLTFRVKGATLTVLYDKARLSNLRAALTAAKKQAQETEGDSEDVDTK